MMSDSFHLDAAMKEAQWERAKGEIRALIALQGSHTALGEHAYKFTELKELSKEFFRAVEQRELHR